MKSKKNYLKLTLVFLTVFLTSCTTEISLKLNKDNSVSIMLSAGAGEAFTKMLMNTTGDNGAIDEKQVTYELAKAGFTDVVVKVSGKSDVKISMTDKNCSSYLFKSGMLEAKNGKLFLEITRQTLKDFYDSADEQTLNVLDLFLAPVFNDEEMIEKEYLEMVGTFYGESASKEIGGSMVVINIEDSFGDKSNFVLPLSKILSSENSIIFK